MHSETRSMLLELADFLETLPSQRFNYGSWVGADWQGDKKLSCGTTACAGGWATTLDSFRNRGLQLYHAPQSSQPYVAAQSIAVDFMYGSSEAMAYVLDIPSEHAVYLFAPGMTSAEFGNSSPDNHATAKEVAEHIRNYLQQASDDSCFDGP